MVRLLLAAVLLLAASPGVDALTPPPGGECFIVPSSMTTSTLQQVNTCNARLVIQYPEVPGATLYEVRWTALPYNTRTYQRIGPPFRPTPSNGNYPPAGQRWLELGGAAGMTCAQAISYVLDDATDPEVEVCRVNDIDASLTVAPGEVGIGAEFTATATVRNQTSLTFTNVRPVANPTLEGDGEVELLSGPTPASIPSLAFGQTATIAWKYRATKLGSAVLKARLQAETSTGGQVTGDAKCGVGGTTAVAAMPRAETPPATCRVDGGSEVKIVPCTLVLHDGSRALALARVGTDKEAPHDAGYSSGAT